MKNSRVPFIVALIFALMPAASVLAGEDNQQTGSATSSTSAYSNSAFAVELNSGQNASGIMKSVEGGGVKPDAIQYSSAQPNLIQANLAPTHKIQMDQSALGILKTKFEGPNLMEEEGAVPWQKHKNSKGDAPTLEFKDAEPKTLAVDLMFDTYEEKKTLGEGGGRAKSGVLVAGDFDYKKKAQKDFKEALITETTIPEMDGSSKEPAVMQKAHDNKFGYEFAKLVGTPDSPTVTSEELRPARKLITRPEAPSETTKTERTEIIHNSDGLVSKYHETIQDGTTLRLETEPEPKVSFSRATPIPVRVRAEGNETSALGSLKTIATAQKMYVEDDKDEGGDFDYAKPLDPTIKHTNLAEAVLVPGQKGGQKEPATKYTLFLPDGTPVRATANLKMTELEGPATKGEAESAPEDNSATADSDKDEEADP